MEGARLEQDPGDNTAMLLTPDLDVGRYTFVVAVRDDGYPAKIDRQEFDIEIEEPEEEPVEEPAEPFDPSTATYITGVVRDTQGIEQVFVHVKPTGELLKLKVGDAFEVGTVEGVVVLISEGKAMLEIDGEQREFRPGQRLNEGSGSSSRGSQPPTLTRGFTALDRASKQVRPSMVLGCWRRDAGSGAADNDE